MSIEDRIRHFIVDDLGWRGDPSRLTDDYPLIDNDVIDSLGIFQTVTHLEEVEGIEVADQDLVPENFASIRAIASLVTSKKAS
jgi:acyl carrier protein